ncbi:nitrate/nitrite two-component system sensor histidine kinase NarX [Enterobacteriaceae bacterium H20N1]|uniref:Sensor protein n=1 Tax=Dryocola boscaweniae TaxID=2925397 RepID=A0A9X2WB74_9ENTR|nr:nitrate/nitrite two-component system sensor histidine kinase NarX [Dryocola boscaweniae]MCT4703602.1 nitrate/nitrite two-component system sensor histidine kinase NarX [Dryocola boscaweniae]MCT4713619.1 nitrate/nitrite two-component system sensor histidine kinase NarX [Dryocola boscaweniae]MCT4720770.1 nitrate/nitrite two-component system sensor histidine kinase NarX [Dryocola boscaweniae]
MLKRLFSPLTLVNQLALIVLLQASLGIAGMSLASWLAQGIQGNAHAINKAGSLRMQSYRLLAAIPLTEKNDVLFTEMEQTTWSEDLQQAARRDGQQAQLNELQHYWRDTLEPAMKSAKNAQQVTPHVAQFVGRIDQLVSSFDKTTELRLHRVILLQQGMVVLMGLLLLFTVVWLRKRLLRPWRQLLAMASAIGQKDFTHRVNITGRNEMATLGMALNSMSAELAESYSVLEQRVREKTAGLEQKNQILSFLYQANRRLHSQAPLCQRLSPVLSELQKLTPLRHIELRVYEYEDEENYDEYTYQPDSSCEEQGCHLCPREQEPEPVESTALKWRLTDNHIHYGLVLAQLPLGCSLTVDQQQLISTLIEQLAATLALERQYEHQQQLVVMEERAAIARELHDSIAQSLSCLKMQVSCLQMQSEGLPEQSRDLLGQMRHELNTSWRQLRELLTTFRLQLIEPGLRPALETSCQEFSEKLGFAVELDYQLPPRLVPSHQAIHLVQIAREALNNSLKHAQASACGVSVIRQDKQVKLTVWDNGCGIPGNGERRNHYGLIIMRDRAQSLKGDCQIRTRAGGGTEVVVSFMPEAHLSSATGVNDE